mgnify:CR=1 FL=1
MTVAVFDPVFTTEPELELILNTGFASVTPDEVTAAAAASAAAAAAAVAAVVFGGATAMAYDAQPGDAHLPGQVGGGVAVEGDSVSGDRTRELQRLLRDEQAQLVEVLLEAARRFADIEPE